MKTLTYVVASLFVCLSSASAQTEEAAIAPSEDSAPTTEETSTAELRRDEASGNEMRGAAANAPDDGTSAEVLRDPSLAALGVGEYGKRSEAFVLWENAKWGAYIKPIIWVSGSVLGYFPSRDGNDDLANRPATLLVSRFGFEGALTEWASFKLEFQRDLGFSLASNGPQGTSIFEGTASIQARENYVSLHRWGLNLTAGIQTDPASVDFISPHVLGMFGMDPFTRDYLLASGFNLGQGVLLRYTEPFLQSIGAGKLTFGFQYTSGNPLVTSASYSFGGNVTPTGTLFSAPLRSFFNGIPGTNILLTAYSPSLTYSVDFTKNIGFDLRAMAQFLVADVDTTSATDANLEGSNYRATARLRLPYVNLMGGWARRVNQQLALPDLSTRLGDHFETTVISMGAEFNYGPWGLGAHYATVKAEQFDNPNTYNKAKYLNIGASYAFIPSFLSAQLRYASVTNDYENSPVVPTDATIVVGSLILTI